jgi:hypothetical protein
MLIGFRVGSLYHYEQSTTGSNDFTLITDNFNELSVGEHSRPVFADINGDGLEDLLVGDTDGGIHYFQRDGGTGIQQNTTVGLQSKSFQLVQNYPNPFNPKTTIQFDLFANDNVELKIYNINGALVRTLMSEKRPAGSHQATWDGLSDWGSRAASGIYFYKLKAGEFEQNKRMILLR